MIKLIKHWKQSSSWIWGFGKAWELGGIDSWKYKSINQQLSLHSKDVFHCKKCMVPIILIRLFVALPWLVYMKKIKRY